MRLFRYGGVVGAGALRVRVRVLRRTGTLQRVRVRVLRRVRAWVAAQRVRGECRWARASYEAARAGAAVSYVRWVTQVNRQSTTRS